MSSWSGSYCVYVSLKYSQLFIQQTQSNSFLSQAWLTDWWLIHHHLDAYFPLNNNAIDDKLSKQHRQIVLLHHSDVVSRSRLGLHCLPSGYSHDASSPTVVHLFLCHAHSLGFGHTSKISVPPPLFFQLIIFTFGTALTLSPFAVQFVAMEVVMTTIIDMFPTTMRRAGRRERLLLIFCLVCFFSQLVMLTEVSM